jgi:glycine cleavage system H protein
VFVEVPDAGRIIKAGEACAVVESVKAASDVYAPIAGEITAGNPQLAGEPEAVNADAYSAWLMRLRPAPGALAAAALMSSADYEKFLAAEG